MVRVAEHRVTLCRGPQTAQNVRRVHRLVRDSLHRGRVGRPRTSRPVHVPRRALQRSEGVRAEHVEQPRESVERAGIARRGRSVPRAIALLRSLPRDLRQQGAAVHGIDARATLGGGDDAKQTGGLDETSVADADVELLATKSAKVDEDVENDWVHGHFVGGAGEGVDHVVEADRVVDHVVLVLVLVVVVSAQSRSIRLQQKLPQSLIRHGRHLSSYEKPIVQRRQLSLLAPTAHRSGHSSTSEPLSKRRSLRIVSSALSTAAFW